MKRAIKQTEIGLNWVSSWNLRINTLRRAWKTCFFYWRNEKVTWVINERKWREIETNEKQVHSKVNVLKLSDWKG